MLLRVDLTILFLQDLTIFISNTYCLDMILFVLEKFNEFFFVIFTILMLN
jgi:hypothetical protein